MTHRMGPRIPTDTYAHVTVEVETWRRPGGWWPFTRWRGTCKFRPVGGGIPLTIGNEYTGLLYGRSRAAVLRKAKRIERDWYRHRAKPQLEQITL